MAEEKGSDQAAAAAASTRVRIQVPSIILPSNQSITVLSPSQQQQLGVDITQLISGQQLHLLASHLSGTSTGQPVIIVPEAVDDRYEASSSNFISRCQNTTVASDIPAGTSYEITVDVPSAEASSKPPPNESSVVVAASAAAPTAPSKPAPARRGRPNKFVALESGEIVRQQNKPAVVQKKSDLPKRPRGRPRKEKEIHININPSVETKEKETDTSEKNNDKSTSGSNIKDKPKPKRFKRRRISDTDSDFEEGENVREASNTISDSDETDEVPSARLPPRPLSLRSQRLRRSVVKNKRYADYEVDDLPKRPENVWIKENGVSLEINDVSQTQSEENSMQQINDNNDTLDITVVSESLKEKPPGKKRGRKKKAVGEPPTPRKPRINNQLVYNRSANTELDMDFAITEAESKDLVTCGACNTEMPRVKYFQHQNSKHNGLSWILNEEKPVDFRDTSIENQNHLSNLIREAFSRKGGVRSKGKGGFRVTGKYLACEKCEHRSFSAVGYLSHIRFCSVSEEERLERMWTCALCQRTMMPASRYSHEVAHKQNKVKEIEKEVEEEAALQQMMKQSGREKKAPQRRAAAVKAETFMQELLDKDNPELGSNADPLKLGFRRPKESLRGIGSVKSSWWRQLTDNGRALCRHIGCDFSSTDMEEMLKHHVQECSLKPSKVFECLRCTVHCPTETEILDHISKEHASAKVFSESDNDDSENFSAFEATSGDDDDLDEAKVKTRGTKSTPEKSASMTEKGGCSMGMGYSLRCMMPYWTFRNKVPYRPVLKWMLEFCSQNHSETSVFPSLVSPVQVQLLAQPELYKPNTEYSVSFTTSDTHKPTVDAKFISEQEWTSIPAFTGSLDCDVPLFFAGGPVSAMAWCPTPVVLGQEQLLAVSCHRDMDAMPLFGEALPEPGLVQIWSLGALDNKELPSAVPHLLLGLGHEWGAVRQLSWCPSGCWSPSAGHYGLLAAACADGTVRIFPVPKCDDNQQFIQAQAMLTLLPHSLPERKSPCLRISWYPGRGHSVVAGGFADGLVCLWKLNSSSQLLRNVNSENNEEQLYAYLKFQAHTGPVTALELSTMGEEEPRYLFTGGLAEKTMTYWDLEKSGEISLGNYTRKARVTNSTWMSLWPSAVTSFEDLQLGSTFIPPRNFCRHFMILPHNSSALSIDKGDWLNGIAQSTLAGEITLMLLNQVIFGMDNEKLQREKRALLTRTCIANVPIKEEAASYEEAKTDKNNVTFLTYKEAGSQGVVFCDVNLDSDHVWCKESKSGQLPEKMDSSPSVNYPLAAINHVSWNPNASSFGWVAAGYQCGIVRAIHIKCKSSDQIIKTSLNKMKNEN